MFRIEEDKNLISFQISSEFKNVERIISEVKEFLYEMDISLSSGLKTVIRELLINGIEHGNKSNIDKKVKCTLEKEDSELFRVSVEDEGKGFDFTKVNMRMPKDPQNERSRGFPLINSFSEDIEFNSAGNSVSAVVIVKGETRFDIKMDSGQAIIKPSGDITAAIAEDFRVKLNDLFQRGITKFFFDLEDVEDMDSVSLSVFVILAKILANKEKELKIINANDDLRNLFRMTRLDKIYEIAGKNN